MWKGGGRVGRIDLKEKEDNGVSYTNFRAKETANGVGAVGTRKVILTGYPKITLVKGSYKYPDELQFSLAMHKDQSPEFKDRHDTKWNCVEINMPVEQGKHIIEAVYLELKKRGEL